MDKQAINELKFNYNYLLNRYNKGCDYLSEHRSEIDKWLPKLLQIQENLSLTLDEIMKYEKVDKEMEKYMLEGKKMIESRFSKNKRLPYKQISKDDIVIVKKSSGNILAYFTIKKVLFFDLSKTSIMEIKAKYNNELCVNDEFWISKKDCNYATLIFIDKLIRLKAFHINKKGMQTWIKL